MSPNLPSASVEEMKDAENIIYTKGSLGYDPPRAKSDPELYIIGSGLMTDYSASSPSPWSSYYSTLNSVTLQNEPNTSGILSIGDYAFAGFENLRSVNLPSTLTTIGTHSFENCKYLVQITIPQFVNTVKQDAFVGCTSLTQDSVTYEGSLVSIVENGGWYTNSDHSCGIGVSSVYCTTEQEYITHWGSCGQDMWWYITKSKVLHIIGSGQMADYSASSPSPWYGLSDHIESIDIGSSIESIGSYAFADQNITEIYIPSGVESIGQHAFDNCVNIATLKIDTLDWYIQNASSILSPPLSAVDGMYPCHVYAGDTLVTSISIPNSVTSLPDEFFESWSDIRTVDLNSAYDFGDYLFAYCTGISSIVIPGGPAGITTEISEGCFYRCTSLESVELPKTLSSIETNAFYLCPVSDIYYHGTEEQWSRITVESGNDFSATRIHYEAGDHLFYILENIENTSPVQKRLSFNGYGDMYTSSHWGTGDRDYPWYLYNSSITDLIFSDGVTSLASDSFNYLRVRNIVLPDTVVSIGAGCFAQSSSIQSIHLSSHLTSIGRHAFINCSGITQLTIPDTVTHLNNIMEGCRSLTTLTIGSGLATVADDAFIRLRSLNYIYVDSNNTQFQSINGILYSKDSTVLYKYPGEMPGTVYNVPSGVLRIWSYALSSTTKLQYLGISETVTNISRTSFVPAYAPDTSSLVSIQVSTNNSTYSADSYGVLYDDVNHRCVYCPVNAVVSSGIYTLKSSCTAVNQYAFDTAKNIDKLYLPSGVTSIREYCFAFSSITKLYFPSSLTTIGSHIIVGTSQLTDIYYSGSSAQWGQITTTSTSWIYTEARISTAVVHFDSLNVALSQSSISGTRGMTLTYTTSELQAIVNGSQISEAPAIFFNQLGYPVPTATYPYITICMHTNLTQPTQLYNKFYFSEEPRSYSEAKSKGQSLINSASSTTYDIIIFDMSAVYTATGVSDVEWIFYSLGTGSVGNLKIRFLEFSKEPCKTLQELAQ